MLNFRDRTPNHTDRRATELLIIMIGNSSNRHTILIWFYLTLFQIISDLFDIMACLLPIYKKSIYLYPLLGPYITNLDWARWRCVIFSEDIIIIIYIE
jgi:hypothetical protein